MQAHGRGTLVTWRQDKGFGFIRPDDGSKDVFVHSRDFGGIARSPRVGDVIHFQRVGDGKGRLRAADVRVEGLARAPSEPHRPKPARQSARARPVSNQRELPFPALAWSVVVLFTAALIWLTIFTPLTILALPLYLSASFIAFLLYAFDKAAAMNKRWRTSENTLLMVGLLGGWPGALVAQGMFRHKSRKASFLVPFWVSVVINCAGLIGASTKDSAAAISRILN